MKEQTKNITLSKNKPVIEDIVLSKEKMQELKSKVESSVVRKSRIIRRSIGGNCTYCAGIPSKKVSYDVGDGASKIEYYCNDCFQRWVASI